MKRRLLASSVFAGAALGMMVAPAVAQEDEESVQQTVVVTGSLIPTDGNLVETSPVTSLTSEAFTERGAVRVEDIINTLPQAFGAQGANLANGGTGTASVNLRGLGSSRTLVLLNGRRLPYGSLNTVAPDVNFIPSALIERVDVLTGGASATYGSDAISGVVNFVLDTDFEGLRFDTNYSFYQHDNGGELQGLLQEFASGNPDQYRVPSGSTSDGESIDITAIFGGKFDNGKGQMTGFLGFQNTNEVLQGDRDYSQCALGTRSGGTEFTCSGSSTNQFANILELDANYAFPNGSVWARVDPTSGTIVDRNFVSDTFNFNPFNHFQRPNERYTAGMFTSYQINDNVNAYGEFMFMDNQTNSQIAPSGIFGLGVAGDAGGINCDNAYFSAQQLEFLCGSNGLTADDVAPIILLRRNVEGGARNNDIRHTTFRGVIGINGEIGDSPFSYDLSATFANVHRAEVYNNDLSKANVAKALDAVFDANGNIVCAVNADDITANDDANCVPYDAWSGNAPDPAAVNYIVSPLNRDGDVTQTIVTGQVFGDLGEFGIVSPMAEDGIKVAFGVEYRRDTLDSNPDAAFQSGDGAGQGGPINALSGSQETYDVFMELNAPLIQDRPGIKSLGIDAAFRRSNYDNVSADAWKIGGEYAPTDDVRFRAAFQRAVRAANIFELFSAQGIGLFNLTAGANGNFDPCSGTTPTATFAQCANTGVTAAQYGNIADNPAGQFNTLTGGNLNLEPETADTFTIGFVATPTMLPGLTVSVDYFDIEVEDYINTVPQDLALSQCLETGDQFFCSLVTRGNGGTLWANNTGFITATNVNTGAISTSGVDVLASYDFDVEGYGNFGLEYVGTFLDSLEVQPLPTSTGDEIFDCAGTYGSACQTNFGAGTNPDYRHKASIRWNNDGKLSVTGSWRHFAEVNLQGSTATDSINYSLASQDYFDLSGNYDLFENTSIRFGVNNVMDEDPPLSSVVGTAPGNGNTYPQVYDALGRYIFMGATIDF